MRVRTVRHTVAIAAAVLLLHGAIWFVASNVIRGRLDSARLLAALRLIDVQVGAVERTGYPLAAGVTWHDVEFGPRGLPFGVRVATARIALIVVPSLLHAPTYRAELPDPVRVTTPNGTTLTIAAADVRIEAPWGDPSTATLTAAGVRVAIQAEIARIARFRSTAQTTARTLDTRAEGIEVLTGGGRPTQRIATASVSLALDGPPLPALTEGGQAAVDALIRWRDGGGVVRIVDGAIGWGPVDAEAQGRITLDALLQPAGTGELRVAGGGAGLDALAASGMLSPHAAQAIQALLALLPTTVKAGGHDAVRLPVSVAAGRLGVAGYPLLKLPSLSLP